VQIVTAEEHNIFGGLVAAMFPKRSPGVGAGVPTEFVGIQDTFTESAPTRNCSQNTASMLTALRRNRKSAQTQIKLNMMGADY
jgi:transketolase C-terminal domain/subunit